MNEQFLSKLISEFTNLSYSDLIVLNKLSEYYDIFSVDDLMNKNMDIIINELILNVLPYNVARKMVYNNKLICSFVHFTNNQVICLEGYENNPSIKKEVDRINTILKNES